MTRTKLGKLIAALTLLTVLFISAFTQTPNSDVSKQHAPAKDSATPPGSKQKSNGHLVMTPEERREQQEAAFKLLNKAPVLTSESRLERDDFVSFTRAITFSSSEIKTDKQAIAELEAVVANAGNPKASLKSDPKDNEVTYRRYVDDSAPWLSATTNTEVSVRPALYVFRCTNKKTGETQQKTQSCTHNCTVEFKF